MSDPDTPKSQQTAYERWEMAAFSEEEVNSGHFRSNKNRRASDAEKASAEEDVAKALESAKVLENARKEAYTKGMQEGFEVGMAKAKEYAVKDNEKFLAITTTFEQALENIDQKIEEDVLALALEMAKLMLKTKINVDPEVILPVVRDAIHYLPHVQKPASVIVHPEDARILRERLGDELAEHAWQVQEDHNIERGGCLVETGENQIDATNAVRWKRIADALAQCNDWLLS